MAYTIEINGVDKTSLMLADTLRVNPTADGRKSMSCTIKTTAATFLPDFGQDIKVKKAGNVEFGGVIKVAPFDRAEPGTGNTTLLFIEISSDGYNSKPYDRTINIKFDNASAADIVNYCLYYLAADGITAGTINTGANPMGENGEYDAAGKTIGLVLDECADASGFKWKINDDKTLDFKAEDAVANAEHDIVEGGAFTDYRKVKITRTMDGYANKVFLRCGIDDITALQIVSIVQDTAEITARQTAEGGASYSSGVYGITIDRPDVSTQADADIISAKELQKRCRGPIQIEFDSNTLDWTTGKKLKVNLPTFGISSDTYFLVEEASLDRATSVPTMHIKGTRRNEDSFSTQRSQSVTDFWSKVVNQNSCGGSGGGLSTTILKSLVKDYNATNAAQVTVDNTEDTIVTKTFTLDIKSDIKVIFSCQGLADDAMSLTLKTYIGGVARTLQPIHEIFGANKVLLNLTDTILAQAPGSVTIAVKGTTSNGSFVIAANFATMDIFVISLVSGIALADVAGFVLTVIDDDEIDLAWTNPPAVGFTGVELYRHSADLATHDRAWCDANATLIYSGALELYNNTGLDELTLYYYKIFAVYSDSGTYYSPGVSGSATTEGVYQQWTGYPQSPFLLSLYPYEIINNEGAIPVLHARLERPYYVNAVNELRGTGASGVYYQLIGGAWVYQGTWGTIGGYAIPFCVESNFNLRDTQDESGILYFAKTTP